MGIPLPALDTRPPQQPEDPLSQYAKVLSLKNMMQQQQLIPGQIEEQRIQIQQAHKAQADQRAADAAFQEWDGKDYSSLPELLRKHGGSADAYMGLRNSLIKQQQEIGTYDETKLKNELTRNDILSGLIDQVQSAPPEQRGQAFQGALQQASRIGVDPQHLQQFSQVANAPIEQQDKALEFVKKGLIAHKAQLEQASKAQADAIARQKAQQEAALAPSQLQKSEADANLAQQEAAFGGKKSQKEMLQRQLIQAENSGDTAAAAKFKQQLKDIDPLAQQRISISMQGLGVGGPGGLTDAALDNAAEQYYRTGQIPRIYGRAGGVVQAEIMNRAGALHPNANYAANSAEFKANQQSLSSLSRQRDMVMAFENTAGKNLDLFLSKAKPIVDTGSPLINIPVRMASDKLVGSTNMAAYNAARQVALTEIAKVVNNPGLAGQLSDSARHEVEALSPANATLAQIYNVATVLKADMHNRRLGYDEQLSDIKGRLKQAPGGEDTGESNSSIPIGTVKTFPNGNKGKWDGQGWVKQ